MPYVNIKITNENVTPEAKQALIEGTAALLLKVLNKDPSSTFTVIDVVQTEDWGVGYETVTALRRRQARLLRLPDD